jgi:dCTP diphosphatase
MTPSIKAEAQLSIAELTSAVQEFADARDWGQFHDPKNLAMALASEAGELVSILRWVSNDAADCFVEVEKNRAELADEIGDIGISLLLLCARTDISLGRAVTEKLAKNALKYPVELSRGRSAPPQLDSEG